MSKYASKITLTVNGQTIEDFKSVKIHEVEYAKPVNLMNKTGFVKVPQRHQVTVNYIVPNEAEFDFSKVEDSTLTIGKEDGGTISYTGVTTLKVGETEFDGDKEAVRPITFMATYRKEE
ncbi:MAG: hypothetical protein HY890_02890 [Deltaproteobacteria bacterium]|nr:hypothetical protein [Deltaproteobacteria bacterium]